MGSAMGWPPSRRARRGSDRDEPLGLSERIVAGGKPGHASPPRHAGCPCGFRLLARGERTGRGAGRPRRRSDDRGRAMIEIVSAGRCIACDVCVKVCPANVFDATPNRRRSSPARPTARPASCARSTARPTRCMSRPMPKVPRQSPKGRSRLPGCSAATLARSGGGAANPAAPERPDLSPPRRRPVRALGPVDDRRCPARIRTRGTGSTSPGSSRSPVRRKPLRS